MKQRIRLILVWLVLATSARATSQPSPEPDPPVGPEEEAPPEEAPAEAVEPAAEPDASVEREAQEAEAPPPSSDPNAARDSEDDIIVTGTRIRSKTSFGESAPVEVVDRKQLERTGVSNVAEALQYMTVTQGNATAALGAAGGAAGVNLRGLGAGATLLLVNGRRTNPSGTGPGPVYADLSVIPVAAIERIEVLKAGAAAIYGADAVGGVVNVITRRKWNGGRIQVDGEMTSRADLGEYTVSASLGAVAERSRIMAAAGYFRRGELTSDRRPFSEDKFWSAQGYPGAFLTTATPAMGDVPAMPPGVPMPDPACGPTTGTTTTPFLGGQGCRFDYRPYIALVAHAERANAFVSGDYDVTHHLTAFAELLLSRFRGDGPLPLYPILAPYPVVPATHVDNPYGRAVSFVGRPGGGRPNLKTVTSTADDSLRAVVGLKGDWAGAGAGTVFESWTWEASASLGISRFRRTIDDTLRDAFQAALNSCSDSKNLAGCFNPFYSATDGTGTANSQEVIDSFSGREMETSDHSLHTYNAGLSGSLLALPGGDLGMAFGGEWRREWRSAELDHDQRQGRYAFIGLSKDALARRSVYSGYVELRWPFARGFELQTAARLEYYNDTNSTPISPFAGISIVPSEMIGSEQTPTALRRLQIRANASKAFRAPTIFNTYPGATTIGTPLQYKGQNQYTRVTYLGNTSLEPETAYTLSGGMNWTPFDQLSLTADYWYYDYRNRIQVEVPQQLLNTWVQNGMPANDPHVMVDPVTGTIGPIISSSINVEGSVITSGLDFGATANLLRGAARERPTLSIGVQGTYTINYDIPLREGSPRNLPNGMLIGAKDCTGTAVLDRCHVAGKRNNNNIAPVIPRLKLNVPFFFAYAGHSLTVTGHYISGYEDDVEPRLDGSFSMVDPWVTLDIQYGYSLPDFIGKELTLRVGCQNALDRMPSHVNGVAAVYDFEVHDPRGRMLYAKLGAEF